MKTNLPYFTHETDARNHPKLKAIRAKYGFAGVGRFWTLNEIIGEADNCRLDLSRKIYKSNLADELKMSPDELEEFLVFLADPEECGILVYESGELRTEHTQEDLSRMIANREKSQEVYRRKKERNLDSTGRKADSTGRKNTEERRGEERRKEKEQEEEEPAAAAGDVDDIKDKLASFGIALDEADLSRIRGYLAEKGLPLDFLTYVLGEVKTKNPQNFLPFFRRAVFWPDVLDRYRLKARAEEAQKPPPDPPKRCPTCGRTTVWTEDRAACKVCGLFWIYIQDSREWREETYPAKIAAG